jgi:hypothetical protein
VNDHEDQDHEDPIRAAELRERDRAHAAELDRLHADVLYPDGHTDQEDSGS